jgi:hypothetical protein
MKPSSRMLLPTASMILRGPAGLRIIRAILAGERDPEVLACLRHLVQPSENIRITPNEDTGVVFGEGAQTRKRLRIQLVRRRPSKAVRRNTALEQKVFDARQCVGIKVNILAYAAISDGLYVALRWCRKINDLPVFERIQATILDLQIMQQYHDDFFAVPSALRTSATHSGEVKALGEASRITASQRAAQ